MSQPHPPSAPRVVLTVSSRGRNAACWVGVTNHANRIAVEGFSTFEALGDVLPTVNDAVFNGIVTALQDLHRGQYFDHAFRIVVDSLFVFELMTGARVTRKKRFTAHRDRVNELLRDLRAASVEFIGPRPVC